MKDSEGSLVKALEHNKKPQENSTHEPVVHEEECDHMARTPYTCRHSNLVSQHNDVCLRTTNICNNNHANKVLEKRFTCNVCSKAFLTGADLKRHMRVHTGEKPFYCYMCNRPFSDFSKLLAHKQLHIEKKLFSCDICNKTFSRKSSLYFHNRVHTGEKPVTCKL